MSTHISFHDSLDRCLKNPEFKAEWDRLSKVYQRIRYEIEKEICKEPTENSGLYWSGSSTNK